MLADGGPPTTSFIGHGHGHGPGGHGNVSQELQRHCASVGPNDPVCAGIAGGEMAEQLLTKPPLSCVVKLIDEYMDCGTRLTESQEVAGYNAFTNATGLKPINLAEVFNIMQDQADTLFQLNAFYFFIPVLILILIIIIILAATNKMSWAAAIFFAVLAIYILYISSIVYQIAAENSYHRKFDQLRDLANTADESYRAGVAYIPQGLLATACAITCVGDDCGSDPSTCWTCNEPDCKPCPCRGSKPSCKSCKGSGKIH